MMDRGYLTLMRVRGVPLRLHWTLPLGALLLSGGRLEPGLWLGIVLVIALHEAGHALVVHRAGLVNLGVDLTASAGDASGRDTRRPSSARWSPGAACSRSSRCSRP